MIIQAYLTKQQNHYRQALLLGNQDIAADAQWRAASHSDLLSTAEHSHTELSPQRVTALVAALGWQ